MQAQRQGHRRWFTLLTMWICWAVPCLENAAAAPPQSAEPDGELDKIDRLEAQELPLLASDLSANQHAAEDGMLEQDALDRFSGHLDLLWMRVAR